MDTLVTYQKQYENKNTTVEELDTLLHVTIHQLTNKHNTYEKYFLTKIYLKGVPNLYYDPKQN